MAFGYAGYYFAMKGVHDVASHVVLEDDGGGQIDEKEASFQLMWDTEVGKAKVILSTEVVFDVEKDDKIGKVSVNSGTDLVPENFRTIDSPSLSERGLLGTGDLPTETADRDGTYTLESLEMYLD